jgi:hypothetical protein
MSNENPCTLPTTDIEALQFAEVLIAADILTTPADVIYFLRRPDKYGREHQAWTAAGRPVDGSPAWNATRAVIGAIADGDPPLAIAP